MKPTQRYKKQSEGREMLSENVKQHLKLSAVGNRYIIETDFTPAELKIIINGPSFLKKKKPSQSTNSVI